MDAPDFDQQLANLRAERNRLRALPSEPARVDERLTGVLVRDHWITLDDAGKRAYLLAGDTKVHASRTDRWITGNPYRLIGALRQR